MPSQNIALRRSQCCAGFPRVFGQLVLSTSALVAAALIASDPSAAQTAAPSSGQPGATVPGATEPAASPPAAHQKHLPQISVSGRRPIKRGKVKNPQPQAAPSAPNTDAGPSAPNPGAGSATALSGIPATPLNGVATSASRLGLPVVETPASVDIVTAQTIQEQGYRTTADTAQGAVGVLSVDAAGAPANFSMRGFSFSEVNTLYNGISDRAVRYYVALDGDRQSRSGRVPQRSVIDNDRAQPDRRFGELCQPAADQRADPERSGLFF